MYIALAILFAIFAAIAALIAAGISLHRGRISGAPFYPAGTVVVRMALREACLKPHEHFYDLGAGTGAALAIAAREFDAHATGYEVSLFAFIVAKINLFLRGARTQLFHRNFFDADLSGADVVFCFLAVRTMAAVEEKLKSTLKPGARAAIYAFPLPTLVPARIIPVRGQWKLFLYEFHIDSAASEALYLEPEVNYGNSHIA